MRGDCLRIYITHSRRTDKFDEFLAKLQANHPENSYFSPLHNFCFFRASREYKDGIIEFCLDWLNESEKLVVVGKQNERMREEIAFAKLCNMEVEYLEFK